MIASREFSAHFYCSECGAGPRSLDEIIYQCPECRGLLEVRQDLNQLQQKSAGEWKKFFEDRQSRGRWPWRSGVWSKKEWVLPALAEEHIVSLGEGYTPLVPAGRLGESLGLRDLWIKQCGTSHTGSFKDLGMTVLVSHVHSLMARGEAAIHAIACASTGDTSAALAAYAAAVNIPSLVFLPANKVSLPQLTQPIANGSHVLSLDTDFDGCMKIVKAITRDQRIYLANSMNSLRVEGQKTLSMEIVEQLDWEVPDWVIIPGGNLGNVSALGKGFIEMQSLGIIDRLPRIAVAQAEKANPLYRWHSEGLDQVEPIEAGATLASAIRIGHPVSAKKAVKIIETFDGIVEQASEAELTEASIRADRTGFFTCPHTGVTLAVLIKGMKKGWIKPNHRTVVISTAHGLKFNQFKMDGHLGKLEGSKNETNRPVELPNDPKKVEEFLEEKKIL